MSRNVPQAPIASVTTRIIDLPLLQMENKTSEFKLETLHQPLHLNPANFQFSFTGTNAWYSGVEMAVAVQANNIRFQAIRDAVLHIHVYLNRQEIYKSNTSSPADIMPQRNLSHVFRFRPFIPGDMHIRTAIKGLFNSQPFEVSDTIVVKIIPSFDIQTRTSHKQIVEVKMRNDIPIGVTNITLSGSNGEKMFVTDRMEPGNVYCGIIKMLGISKDVTINFDLPFGKDCVMKASIQQAPSEPHYPLSFEFIGIPQSYKCFKPFDATIKVTNHEKVPLSGKAQIETKNQGIYPHGSTQFEVEKLEPGKSTEIHMQYVGMIPGVQQIPPINFTIAQLPPFKITPSCGVILIGTGDLD